MSEVHDVFNAAKPAEVDRYLNEQIAKGLCAPCFDAGYIPARAPNGVYAIRFCRCPEGRALLERVRNWTAKDWRDCDKELADAYAVAIQDEDLMKAAGVKR